MRGARHLGMPWMQARNVGERAHWKLVVTFVIKHDKWREPPRMENMNAGFVSGMDTPAHFTVVYLAAPGYPACGCVKRTQPALIPADLVGKLEEIVDEEVARGRFTPGTCRGLPTEACPPQFDARDLGQLGTADPDAAGIASRALFSADELRAKAEQERQRRVEAGIADGVEMMQPKKAPPFDQLLVSILAQARTS